MLFPLDENYMQKISAIIPLYNVEKHIRRCVESILAQTYKNWELILVDDGSPDHSGSICDEYARIDNRIKVIHKCNGGSASARNAGLSVAIGDYITFVDGDDWIENNGIEKMMQCAEATDADIVMADFTIEQSDGSCTVRKEGFGNPDAIELMKAMMTGKLHGSNCNKIYRRSLIVANDIHFIDSADYTEDLAFNIKLLTLTNKIAYRPIAYYHYCIYDNSMSHTQASPDVMRRKDLQKVTNVEDFSNWLYSKGLGKQVEKELNYCKLITKMPFLRVVTRRSCLRWCAIFPEADKAIWENDRLPVSYKLELQLLRMKCLWLFIGIQKIKLLLHR